MNQNQKHSFPTSEQNQCGICLQQCKKPLHCKGPCKKPFCTQCIVESKMISKNACPNRCSQPFYIQIPSPQLRCPFNPQDCNISIPTAKRLKTHYQICLFATPQQRLPLRLQHKFQCNLLHRLSYISIQSYQILYRQQKLILQITQKCKDCGEQQVCLACCLKCSTKQNRIFYCQKCRPVPCSKSTCPNSHKLRKCTRAGKKKWCDICQLPVQLIDTFAYCCGKCSFDLCRVCYEGLPETNEIILKPIDVKALTALAIEEDIDSESDWKEDEDQSFDGAPRKRSKKM